MEGFTAVELMVVVAIAAILATLAMPSFRDVVDNYRLRRAAEDLSSSLYLARSEGIKRGADVIIEKASPSGCAAADIDAQWECGWTVSADAGARVLMTSPIAQGVTIRSTSATWKNSLPADRWGQIGGAGFFGFVLTPERKESGATPLALCMTAGGRLEMRKGDSC